MFGFCLEIHRMAKKKILMLDDTDPDATEEFSKLQVQSCMYRYVSNYMM